VNSQRHVLRWLPTASLLLALMTAPCAAADSFPWQRYQEYPDEWYESFEAKRIAANVLSHQSPLGGWPKNIDTGAKKYEGDPKALRGTFEAGTTLGELRFLARMIRVNNDERYRSAFNLGLKYTLDAQYPTGGWPVVFPPTKGYFRFITFNDGHMVNILGFLRDVVEVKDFGFVRKDKRVLARKAFERGIDCIVKCQIVFEDEPSAWCARHDEKTLEPRPGKKFEPVALSANDSAAILLLLMSFDKPDRDLVRAIHTGCAWFQSAQLTGVRVEKTKDDVVATRDQDAPPLWARIYEIGKNRPIFTRRDGTIMPRLADIELERRNEVVWYGTWGEAVLKRYAAWKDQQPAP
jgi:PelA/Pel-15E family pectate lyase